MHVDRAEAVARKALSSLPGRLAHVSAVAAAADAISHLLRVDRQVLVGAAWLHDIGYAPSVTITGFHPLDGARFLRGEGIDPRVVNLVAHHSHAVIEARERGLEKELLDEFPLDAALPHTALCFCDMTTGPRGQRMAVEERLAEIRQRYGPGDVVTRFIERAEPSIVATVELVEKQLAAAGAQSR